MRKAKREAFMKIRQRPGMINISIPTNLNYDGVMGYCCLLIGVLQCMKNNNPSANDHSYSVPFDYLKEAGIKTPVLALIDAMIESSFEYNSKNMSVSGGNLVVTGASWTETEKEENTEYYITTRFGSEINAFLNDGIDIKTMIERFGEDIPKWGEENDME